MAFKVFLFCGVTRVLASFFSLLLSSGIAFSITVFTALGSVLTLCPSPTSFVASFLLLPGTSEVSLLHGTSKVLRWFNCFRRRTAEVGVEEGCWRGCQGLHEMDYPVSHGGREFIRAEKIFWMRGFEKFCSLTFQCEEAGQVATLLPTEALAK